MAPLHIIQLGLPADYSGFDEEAQKWVKGLLEKGEQKMEAAGHKYLTFNVVPDTGVEKLTLYLKENQIDGAVIGFGIRREANLAHFMEQLIDTVRTHAPKAKIMFNTSPDSSLEAVQRWFPEGTTK